MGKKKIIHFSCYGPNFKVYNEVVKNKILKGELTWKQLN
jgi:hypothetical protein